ncbi:MAG: SixA phosphatase family protein [Oligoflexus sp.]
MQQKKQAVILRHAQATSPASAPTDEERPLTEAGKRQALLLGQQWAKMSWFPDLVIVSPAKRTLETLAAVEEGLGRNDLNRNVYPNFYLGGHHEMMVAMAQMKQDYERLLLIGHNPGWSDAIAYLTEQYLSMETGQAIEILPLDCQLDWMTILASPGSCKIGQSWR